MAWQPVEYEPKFEDQGPEKPAPEANGTWEPVDYNPFDKTRPVGEEGFVGGLKEAGRGFAHGVAAELPQTVGKTLQQAGQEDLGQRVRKKGEANEKALPGLQESLIGQSRDSASSVRGAAYEAGDMAASSWGLPLTGAAIGGLVGGLPGAAAGFGLTTLGQLPLFYASQAQDTSERVKDELTKQGVDPAEADQRALEAGRKAGAIEAGGELLADALPLAKLAKPFAKAGAKEVIQGLARRPLSTTAKDLGQILGAEVGTEVGQALGEGYVEQQAGVPHPNLWKEGASVIVPTAMMSLVPGLGVEAHSRVKLAQLQSRFADGTAPEQERLGSAQALTNAIAQQDPGLAQTFAAYAADRIGAKAPIEIQPDQFYPQWAAARLPNSGQGAVGPETPAAPGSAAPLSPEQAMPAAGQGPVTPTAAPANEGPLTRATRRVRPLDLPYVTGDASHETIGSHAGVSASAEPGGTPGATPAGGQEKARPFQEPDILSLLGRLTPGSQPGGSTALGNAPGPAGSRQRQDVTPTPPAKEGEVLDRAPAGKGKTRQLPRTAIEGEAVQTQPLGQQGQMTQTTPPKEGEVLPRDEQTASGQLPRPPIEGEAHAQQDTQTSATDGSLRPRGGLPELPAAQGRPGVQPGGQGGQATQPTPGQGQRPGANLPALEGPRPGTVAAIDQAAHEAATSPQNNRPEPTDAQAKAGNYKKGHLNFHGLDLTIENPRGSTRSGVDPTGKPWSVQMLAHYGYIKRTEGHDGEHVDVYLGSNPTSDRVFIVNQKDPHTGKFDEHKVILGVKRKETAQALYDAHFSDKSGPKRRSAIHELSLDEFKAWLKSGDTKAEYRPAVAPPPPAADTKKNKKDKKPPKGETTTPGNTEGSNAREAERRIYRQVVDAGEVQEAALNGYDEAFTKLVKQYFARFAKEEPALTAYDAEALPEKTLKAIWKEAKQLAIEAKRDPKIYDAALAQAIETAQVPAEEKSLRAFREGFDHALAGKTKSTLPQDLATYRLAGYEAGQKWLKTEEGRFWYTGKRGTKLENTGIELRRHWEQMKATLDTMSSADVVAAVKALEKATVRSELFNPTLHAEATPGLQRYVEALRNNLTPFLEWYARKYTYKWSRKQGFTQRIQEHFSNGDKKIEEGREQAKLYIDTISELSQLLNGKRTIAEAVEALEPAIEQPDGKGYTRLGKAVLTYARDTTDAFSHLWLYKLPKQFKADEDRVDEATSRATPLTRPRLDKITRQKVPDYRKGKNVTPQEFKETFGFADVGFGKWVNTKQDQDHLNYAYDAFRDLAALLGIQPKDISLGGTLYFTIGALGYGKHAAHYQDKHKTPDGRYVPVINVTNTKGDGTLAHEWMHALDFHLQRHGEYGVKLMSGFKDALARRYLTDFAEVKSRLPDFFSKRAHFTNTPKDPIAQGRQAVLYYAKWNSTHFKRNGDALGEDYWGSPVELFARAGEAWVFDDLPGTNDYLVNNWVEADKVTPPKYRGTPYPTGDERSYFAALYRDLFVSLDWTAAGPRSKQDPIFLTNLYAQRKAWEEARQKLHDEVPQLYQAWLASREEERLKKEEAERAERERQLQALAEEKAREKTAGLGTPGPASEEELSDLFDAIAAQVREERQEKPDAPPPGETTVATEEELDHLFTPRTPENKTPRPPSEPRPPREPGTKTRTESTAETTTRLIKEAAKLGVTGLDDALQGLAELFGGNKIQSFPGGIDEASYQRARPFFERSLARFKAAGRTLGELIKFLIEQFGEGIKPFVIRFAREEGLSTRGTLNGETTNDGLQDNRPTDAEGPQSDGVPTPAEGGGTQDLPGNDTAGLPGDGNGTGHESVPGSAGDRTDTGDGSTATDRPGGTDQSTGGGTQSDGRQLKGQNYRITDADALGTGGWKTRAKQNIAAIRLLKKINALQRPATREEQAVLVKYVGWGASELANNIFKQPHAQAFREGWEDLGKDLEALLTPEEYAEARASTRNAHYTSVGMIRGIYAGLERLGFTGGKVLEPGAGVGHFMGLRPDGLAEHTRYTAVELDPTSAAIAKLLYPKEDVRHQDFIKLLMPDSFYDAVIGNPPFASEPVLADKRYANQRFALHDYFIAKSLDLLRPGGVTALITSRYTMDKVERRMRKYIADRADFLGAIRLPQTAFKENAGTEVVTDILFFRKRLPNEAPAGQAWLETRAVKTPEGNVPVNQYFADHPEMIMGEQRMLGSMYGGNEYTVVPLPGDLQQQVERAIQRLPENVYTQPTTSEQVTDKRDEDLNPTVTKENAYYEKDGKIFQLVNGVGQDVTPKSAKDKDLLKHFIAVRDAALLVLHEQLRNGDYKTAQKALNRHYDAFVKKFGYINKEIVTERVDKAGQLRESVRYPNIRVFEEDPDAYRVASLEIYDRDEQTAKKAAIFSERVIAPEVEPKIENVQDALHVSMFRIGRVDLEDIGKRVGQSPAAVREALGDAIFKNPETGSFEPADLYLSGAVRKKLLFARESAKADPEYARNVPALEQVQPEDLPPSRIQMSLGMPIVEARDVIEFGRRALGIRIHVAHYPEFGSWEVEAADNYTSRSVEATVDWGTADRTAIDLLDSILNNRQVKIYRTVDKDKREFDPKATEAANEKLQKIKERFKTWIWEDGDRAARYVRSFNDTYNDAVRRVFGGDYIDKMQFPGMSAVFTPREHQKRVAWRIVQTGNTYMAHEVGAGKTAASIMAGMELKRLGIKKKPMWVVPNHMLKQFSSEFLELYPGAKILVADEINFEKSKRNRFMGRVANDNWDGIICTQSAFKMMPISAELQERLIREQIDALIDLIAASKGNQAKVKQIERIKKRLEQRLAKILASGTKDKGVSFEESGVDQIFVDEAQDYRKLDFYTNLTSVKGIDPSGSAMTFDLYAKTRYLESLHPGRSTVLMSGTPITNTLAEVFSIQRFLQEPLLKEMRIDNFDAWSNSFGDMLTDLESGPAGKYEYVTRFAQFKNVSLLSKLFAQVGDAVLLRNMPFIVRPDVKTGQRIPVVSEVTPLQQEYKKELAARIERIRERKGAPEPGQDIILTVNTDARHAALDERFIDPTRPPLPNSKIGQLVDNVMEIYRKHDQQKLTQMIFADLGRPEAEEKRGFSVYNEIRKQLIARGIPADEIAFMQDYKKSDQKRRLFKEMNTGKKRILIGSSKAMGTGVNAQVKLKALHHLDPDDYLPSNITQREGRIIRQGNTNKEVEVYAYVTKGSFDEQMWGFLERKQRFIDDFLMGAAGIDQTEDIDGSADQYAMARALSSDDPRVMEVAKLRNDVEKLERLRAAHFDSQVHVRSKIASLKSNIEWKERSAANYEANIPLVKDTRGEAFSATLRGKTYTDRKEFVAALRKYIDERIANAKVDIDEKLGELAGLDLVLYAHPAKNMEGKEDAYVRLRLTGIRGVETNASSGVSRSDLNNHPDADFYGSRLVALEREAREFPDMRDKALEDKARYEAELADARKRLDAPFEQEDTLEEKSARLDQLEKELAGPAPAPDDKEPKFSLAEGPVGKGLSRDVVAGIVRELSKSWKSGFPISIRETPEDLPINAPANAEGLYYRGRLYLVSRNLPDRAAVERVLWHEVTHAGLEALLEDKPLRAALEQIYASNNRIKRLADNHMARNNLDIAHATNEALADLAGTGRLPELKGWRRLVAAIKGWLRTHGFATLFKTWTDADVVDLIARARRTVETGQVRPASLAPAYASEAAPLWYSPAARYIKAKGPGKAPAGQWKMLLDSWVKAGHIKADEVFWSGVRDWLDMQPRPIAKEAVIEYLQNDGVKVTETLSDLEYEKHYVDVTKTPEFREAFTAQMQQRMDKFIRLNSKFLSNDFAENYFQTRLEELARNEGLDLKDLGEAERLPLYHKIPLDEREEGLHKVWHESVRPVFADSVKAALKHDPRFVELSAKLNNKIRPKFQQYALPGGLNYRELLITLPGRESFRSGHWDKPNVVVHVRWTERKDADNKRVLFLEEMQSDWGQEGKQSGFSTNKMIMRYEVKLPNGQIYGEYATDAEADDQAQRIEGATWEPVLETVGGTATAPFVTKTEAWSGLALKRVIRYAAEHGFDRVAWSRGVVHADRYDLAHHVARVVYDVDDQTLLAYGHDNQLLVQEGADPTIADLSRFIGAENARKLYPEIQAALEKRRKFSATHSTEWDDAAGGWIIRDSNGKQVRGKFVSESYGSQAAAQYGIEDYVRQLFKAGTRFGLGPTLNNVDMAIGGEGMTAYYDKMLPNIANGILKKMGGGKVTDYTMPDVIEDTTPASRKADRYFDSTGFQRDDYTRDVKAHVFDLTPDLVAHAMGGMPLFSQKAGIDSPEFKRWFGDWEALARRRLLQALDPVQLTGKEISEFREPLDLKSLRRQAAAYAAAHLRKEVVNRLTGLSIEIRPRGIRETLQHGSGPAKIQSLAAIDQMLEQGVPVESVANYRNKQGVTHIFACPVNINKARFIAALAVRADANGVLFYDHELSTIEGLEAVTPQSGADKQHPAPPQGSLNTLVKAIYQVNPASVSQVVDENGRPALMTHHGHMTGGVFRNVAEQRRAGMKPPKVVEVGLVGHWFSEEGGATHEVYGPNRYEVYLNIRNPLDARNDSATQITRREFEILAKHLDGYLPKAFASVAKAWRDRDLADLPIDENGRIDPKAAGALYDTLDRLSEDKRLRSRIWQLLNWNQLILDYTDRAAAETIPGNDYRDSKAEGQGLGNIDIRERLTNAVKAMGYDGYRAHDSSWVAFDANQIKSANENSGAFDPVNDNIYFSRQDPGFVRRALEAVADLFSGQKTFNAWHTTVGTQYHKAQIDTDAAGETHTFGTFGYVFDRTQDYLTDVSRYTLEAEQEAPELLKRMGGWRDPFAKRFGKDAAKAGQVLFEGTLAGGGNPLHGVRWQEADLRGHLGLNEAQVKLYQEARSAVDKSLDAAAKSVVIRKARLEGISLNRDYDMPDVLAELEQAIGDQIDDANAGLRRWEDEDFLDAKADELSNLHGSEQAIQRALKRLKANATKRLEETIKRLEVLGVDAQKIHDQNEKLKAAGYFPLMRFGRYTVNITKGGEEEFFGTYATQFEANRAARDLREEFPDSNIVVGTLSEEQWRLFAGLSPDTLALFAEHAEFARDPVFQKYLQLAINSRSALKRLIKRKGTPGYSTDMPRTVAAFIASNARMTAGNYHLGDVQRGVDAIPKHKGAVKDEAVKLRAFVTNPLEEAAALRGFLFFNFLGGSIAAGLVNATQPVTMTFPYLTQFTSSTDAAAQIIRAGKEAARNQVPPEMRKDYTRALEEGLVEPHQVHQLAAVARGQGRSIWAHKLLNAWGYFFEAAEGFNRRTTFIAAWRVAKATNQRDAYAFAKKAVEETQGIYNRGNRPNWARGPVGSVVFTFKQFSVAYVEFLKRLPLKSRMIALSVLVVASGLQGLPFADDIDDLIDTIGQWLGLPTNSKKRLRATAAKWLGEGAAPFITHGISAGLPLDVSMRLGVGNIVPGTGLLKLSEQDKGRQLAELAGPVGGVVQSGLKGLELAAHGQSGKAVEGLLPTAIVNVLKGYQMWRDGYSEDTKGRINMRNVSGLEAAVKAIGFTPERQAEQGHLQDIKYTDKSLQQATEQRIADDWARAIANQDRESARTAQDEMKAWNRDNPKLPIVITPRQLQTRIRNARRDKEQRFKASLPREVRAGL